MVKAGPPTAAIQVQFPSKGTSFLTTSTFFYFLPCSFIFVCRKKFLPWSLTNRLGSRFIIGGGGDFIWKIFWPLRVRFLWASGKSKENPAVSKHALYALYLERLLGNVCEFTEYFSVWSRMPAVDKSCCFYMWCWAPPLGREAARSRKRWPCRIKRGFGNI